jgi:transcription elongation factor Elf1
MLGQFSVTSNSLRVLDGTRPTLIRGDELRAFIKTARANRKVQTRIDTFYCLRCRAERHAAHGLADCVIKANRATLTALCEICEMVISKPVAEARIPELAGTLDLKIKRQGVTL